METEILLQNDPLWNRLQVFSLDNADAIFPFSGKLAKQENWTEEFTQKAIGEYKKFIYLCCTLPNGASPSEIIDKVWHLHLTYTEEYWEKFCPDVLHRKLHHHPSKGGKDETEKHRKWFEETLKSYQEIFRQAPPPEIWKPVPRNTSGKSMLQFIGKVILPVIILLAFGYAFGSSHTGVAFYFLGVIFIILLIGIIRKSGNDRKSSENGNTGSGDNGFFFFTCGGTHSCDDGGNASGCGSSCGSSCNSGCGGCGGGD